MRTATSLDMQPIGVTSAADMTFSQKKGTIANFLLRLSSFGSSSCNWKMRIYLDTTSL
jgi:hypothetical protein